MCKIDSVLFNDHEFSKGFLHLDLSLGLPRSSYSDFSSKSYFVGYFVGSSFRLVKQFAFANDAYKYLKRFDCKYKSYDLVVFRVDLSISRL